MSKMLFKYELETPFSFIAYEGIGLKQSKSPVTLQSKKKNDILKVIFDGN